MFYFCKVHVISAENKCVLKKFRALWSDFLIKSVVHMQSTRWPQFLLYSANFFAMIVYSPFLHCAYFWQTEKYSWHSFACTIIQQRHILWNFLLASFIFQILIYYKSTKYLLFYFTFVVAILRYIIIFPQTFTTFQCYLGVRYNIVFFYIYH